MRELSLSNCRLDKRYDIRQRLGQGSYAEIFVARDTLASPQSPHSTIVIKALNVFLQEDVDIDLERTLVENFQMEAAALDRVRHPNIISRLGHGTARDLAGTTFHYLVLEYMSGGDMQSLLRKREIEPAQAFQYIEQVCAGLGHAHLKGVIHRDIKPQNLLLNADLTTVKIADFGVARLSAADSPITRVGTNIYTPPEHSPAFAADGHEVERLTPAADIYSLAKSIYTIMTREAPRPFVNEAITALPDDYANEEWSDALLLALKRATATEPSVRPQSVEEFWFDLGPVLEIVGDSSTVIRSGKLEAPQPHVSRGYTPLVPEQPSFEAVLDANGYVTDKPVKPVIEQYAAKEPPPETLVSSYPAYIPGAKPYVPPNPLPSNTPTAKPKKKRRGLRRFAAFVIFALVFTGALYGTANYFKNSGFVSQLRNGFVAKTATANTDIYLRPTPNTDNDPIGLVTKNSKVKIRDSRDNWYQVEIVEQGRARTGGPSQTTGWLNGKYIDIND